jgi:SAM-dependent methyltransferase
MWDERYSQPGFAFGTAPNDFLVSVASQIPKGDVLSLGEGEGRNAIFLASCGHKVHAVDASLVGLLKARELATRNQVEITTEVTDLSHYKIEPDRWNGIVSIFCHLPPPLRSRLYREAVAGLRPGGAFVLEAYTPKQLVYGTGGPKVAELLVTLDELREELAGLEFVHATELERPVIEGTFHTGLAHVVQVVAKKPVL